jgi:hypothetical protein
MVAYSVHQVLPIVENGLAGGGRRITPRLMQYTRMPWRVPSEAGCLVRTITPPVDAVWAASSSGVSEPPWARLWSRRL